MKKAVDYKPERCECCGQTTTYILAIDRGTANIVKQIALFIEKKGINIVHPRKEMEGDKLSSNEVGNLSRARYHGLIAKASDNPGNYVMTNKGIKFLQGELIPRFAIVSKTEKCQVGYYLPDENKITFKEAMKGEQWDGINYEIVEGRVVLNKK